MRWLDAGVQIVADKSLSGVSGKLRGHGDTCPQAKPRLVGGRRPETWPALLMVASVATVFLAQIIMLSRVRGFGRWDSFLSLIPQPTKFSVGIWLSIGAGLIFGYSNRRMGFLVRDSESSSTHAEVFEQKPFSKWGTFVAVVLLLSCLGLLVSMQKMYQLDGETFSLRLLWGATTVLFILGIIAVRKLEYRKPTRNPAPQFLRKDVFALMAVVALAFILRVYDLSYLPIALNQDNALAGLQAAENIEGRGWKLVGVGEFGIPQISFSMLSISQLFFGRTPFGLRIIEACLGTLLVLGGYLFSWRVFCSHRTALLVAALMACHAGLIHFSRHIMNIDPWVFATFGFTLLVHGASSHRVWAFGLAGLLLGFSSELYLSARVLFMIIPVFLVYVLSYHHLSSRTFLLATSLLAMGWLVSWGPNLADIYLRSYGWMLSNRAQSTVWHIPLLAQVAEGLHITTLHGLLLHQLEPVFLMFQIRGDASSQFPAGNSLFDHYIAPFMWLGFGIGCFSWRSNAGLCLSMLVIAITLFVGQVLQTGGPYWPRIISVMVMGLVLIGVAIESAVAACSCVLQAVTPTSMWQAHKTQLFVRFFKSGLLVSLCGMVAVREWTTWYSAARYAQHPVDVAARAIESLPLNTTVCGLRSKNQVINVGRVEIRFYGRSRPLVELYPLSPEEAVEKCGPEPFAWIVTSEQEHLKELLVRRFPQGKLNAYTSQRDGPILFWMFSPN